MAAQLGPRLKSMCWKRKRLEPQSFGPQYQPTAFRLTLRKGQDERCGLKYLSHHCSDLRTCREDLSNGDLSTLTRSVHPDLFLTSSGMPWVGIAAQKTGVPVVSFSSTLISVSDPIVPPFGTGLIPGQSPVFRLRTRLAWKTMFLRRRMGNRVW